MALRVHGVQVSPPGYACGSIYADDLILVSTLFSFHQYIKLAELEVLTSNGALMFSTAVLRELGMMATIRDNMILSYSVIEFRLIVRYLCIALSQPEKRQMWFTELCVDF